MKRLLKPVLSTLFFAGVLLLSDPVEPGAQETLFVEVGEFVGIHQELNVNGRWGISWGDFNGDGWEDFFVAQRPGSALYLNRGDKHFLDVFTESNIQQGIAMPCGAVWGDYDNDGDLDLFFINSYESFVSFTTPIASSLYRNDGDGLFTDVTETAGVSGLESGNLGGNSSACWIDYDRDGWVDLSVSSSLYGHFLYRNLGDGVFQDVTHQAGFTKPDAIDETERLAVEGCDHAAWSDYDNDGDLDVFLCCGFLFTFGTFNTKNQLFRNNGDGTFTDATETTGVGASNAAKSYNAVWGDYNNDGFFDLYVSNTGSVSLGTATPNELYRNNGDGTFTWANDTAGLGEDVYGVNASWGDVDNDGWLDLFVGLHPSHSDFNAQNPSVLPHPLYMNNGDGTFTNIQADLVNVLDVTGLDDTTHALGIALADYDNDGDLDAVPVESHGEDAIHFYENVKAAEGNRWLKIALRNPERNVFAVGARIEISFNGTTVVREVGPGNDGQAGQLPLTQHVGTADALSAEVNVHWSDGNVESYGTLETNQFHLIEKGSGTSTAVMYWNLY